MPLRVISSADAVENVRHNPYCEIPKRDNPETNRLEPMCSPAFSPSFRLSYDDKIFTIGSCFARNIERALSVRGFDVVTAALAWPDASLGKIGHEVLNSYGVTSIENDLRRALDPAYAFDPKVGFLEVAPGRFIDADIVRNVRPSPFDTVLSYRNAITEVTRRVMDCRVVIMTLGLSEVWYDNVAKAYLNLIPPRKFMADNPGRFELHVLDFGETLRSLRSGIGLLQRFCRRDQRILLTVSPVPLHKTHTVDDVIVANSYSKSVLRTAAQHLATLYPHIDYFPSYESVICSERAAAWEDDQIHVRRELIDLNIARMIEAYMPVDVSAQSAAMPNVANILNEAEDEINARNFETAIRLLEPVRDSLHETPKSAMAYADLCLRLGRPADALAMIDMLPEGGAWQQTLIKGRAMVALGLVEEGIAELRSINDQHAREMHRALCAIFIKLERWDEALGSIMHMAGPRGLLRSPAALGMLAQIHMGRGDIASAEAAYRAAIAADDPSGHIFYDFVEFLVAQNRISDAREMLNQASPSTRLEQRRHDELRIVLPT